MNKTNDTSKLGRATQIRELRDDELQKASGGTFTDIMVESIGIVAGGRGSVASGFIVVTKPTDVVTPIK